MEKKHRILYEKPQKWESQVIIFDVEPNLCYPWDQNIHQIK